MSWDEILGEHKTGAVLLTAESVDPVTAEHKRVGTQAVIQLTDLGAVWKRDRSGLSVHVFSLSKGQGLAGVKLRLLDKETKQIENGEATTDKDGNATLPAEDEARWVFAEREGDGHLIAIQQRRCSVPLYRLGVTESGEDEVEVKSVFLFTERGVYKPGDVVHLKGFARNLDSEESSTCRRARAHGQGDGRERPGNFHQRDNAFRVRFVRGGDQASGGNAWEDIASPCRAKKAIGPEPATAIFKCSNIGRTRSRFPFHRHPPQRDRRNSISPITAKYFMGKPLVKAKLTWSLVARDDAFNRKGSTISPSAMGSKISG